MAQYGLNLDQHFDSLNPTFDPSPISEHNAMCFFSIFL
jgi:hypothetical protein